MKHIQTKYEIAKEKADAIDNQIIYTLSSGKSFRVEAGAGSGKTYSLNIVIEWLQTNRWKEFKSKKQRVICITYTNAAVNVINSRLQPDTFIEPSTIHSFAWNAIKQYQSTLITLIEENNLLPDGIVIDQVENITYTLGIRYMENNTLHLYHNDVIILFSTMLDKPKFRMIFSKLYPIILIDEYQDSFSSIIDKFLAYFIQKDLSPQFGFFGDSWQTIYQSNKVCGLIDDLQIEVIKKESNFRSAQRIVDFLNILRPELPQVSAIDGFAGEVILVHSNDFSGARRIERQFKDDLPHDILEHRLSSIKSLIQQKIASPDENLKILMITHRVLADQQGYNNLYALLGDSFRNEEDSFLLFFMNVIEPIYKALQDNKPQQLFDALGTRQYPVNNKKDKSNWAKLMNRLTESRKGKVFDVLRAVIDSNLIPIPPAINETYKYMLEEPDLIYQSGKVSDLAMLDYSEFISGIEFLRPAAIFSTNHGVKGEEYDNVVFVISRGWNNYNFDKYIPMNSGDISVTSKDSYERNRNLFYVCCSRSKKRLILFVTIPFTGLFREYLEKAIRTDDIYSFSEFHTKYSN